MRQENVRDYDETVLRNTTASTSQSEPQPHALPYPDPGRTAMLPATLLRNGSSLILRKLTSSARDFSPSALVTAHGDSNATPIPKERVATIPNFSRKLTGLPRELSRTQIRDSAPAWGDLSSELSSLHSKEGIQLREQLGLSPSPASRRAHANANNMEILSGSVGAARPTSLGSSAAKDNLSTPDSIANRTTGTLTEHDSPSETSHNHSRSQSAIPANTSYFVQPLLPELRFLESAFMRTHHHFTMLLQEDEALKNNEHAAAAWVQGVQNEINELQAAIAHQDEQIRKLKL